MPDGSPSTVDGAVAVPGSDGGAGGPPVTAAGGPPRRPRKVFLVVGLLLAAALAVGLFTGVGTTTSGGPPEVGASAPGFTLTRLAGAGSVGTPVDGGGGGRPAVLLFFASWCGPCRTEVPALAAAIRHQQGGGDPLSAVAVIGVDSLDPSGGPAFVRGAGVTFPVGADTQGRVTNGLYYFPGDPEAVFIDAQGRIAHIEHGPTSVATLLAWEHRLTRS